VKCSGAQKNNEKYVYQNPVHFTNKWKQIKISMVTQLICIITTKILIQLKDKLGVPR
jgi:hypothetical protein